MDMTFKADGSYEMKMGGPGGLLEFDGTYSVNGEELSVTIAAEPGGETETETSKYAIEGDTLTLFAPEGEDDEDIVLERVE